MEMRVNKKQIKQFLLATACAFFACFNYLTYADTDSAACDKGIDADCDGLTNAEEKLYGTDANNADSDGDGYSDEVEIKSGYDPLKPAPGDKIVSAEKKGFSLLSSGSDAQGTGNGESFSESFSQKISQLVSEKEGDVVTVDDVKSMAETVLDEKIGKPVTLDTLPEIDMSQMKILRQNYSSLSDDERKEKQLEDARQYLEQIIYLFISNAPRSIMSFEDIHTLREDLLYNINTFSESGDNTEYFSDWGDRLELFLDQAGKVEVPETMADIHIKFLRIIKGFLSFREYSFEASDPMERMLVISMANQYNDLLMVFLENDLEKYFAEFDL